MSVVNCVVCCCVLRRVVEQCSMWMSVWCVGEWCSVWMTGVACSKWCHVWGGMFLCCVVFDE